MRGNRVTMKLARGISGRTIPLHQYDYGQILIIEGVELPTAYEVHFSNTRHGESKTSIGNNEGVEIPDEYLLSGGNIFVWLFLHVGNDDGETEFEGVIPVIQRSRPTDIEPTPVQQDVITQTIAALNEAVEQTGQDAADAASAKNAAETAQGKAETAQGKAEEARDAAQTAKMASEDARDRAETAQGKAEQARDRAIEEAGNAANSAASAYRDAERAEQAAAQAGYMFITIDENGHLIYTRTRNVDVNFELDENGHLVMEVV